MRLSCATWLLILGPVAGAQTPGSAVPAALHSLTYGAGGCWDSLTIRDTIIEYFPGVRFFRGYCALEHGDPTSAIVALDRDSVLYLLASQESFDFLVDRHPPPPLDSAHALAYARAALELSGHVSVYAHMITDWAGLPDRAKQATQWRAHEPFLMVARNAFWQVWLFTATTCLDGMYVTRHRLDLFRSGRLLAASDTVVYNSCRGP